jgi:hypothetical protein
MHSFCDWLANTSVSLTIQTVVWIIPTVQSVHILAIAVVMSSALMLEVRMLGFGAATRSMAEVAERFLPWIWSAVVVLLASGAILILGEPGRELMSQVFWLKMSLLIGALVLTAAVHYGLKRSATFWEQRRIGSRVMAGISLLLWVAILTAGRWIAYAEHG